MRQKLFLHIGLHKTGSTSLQKAFFDNRCELADLGVGYLAKKPNGDLGPSHNYLSYHDEPERGARLFQPESLKAHLSELRQPRLVLSTENFSWIFESSEVEKLQQVLSDYDVSVVMYLRRQDQQAVSHFQEASKWEVGRLKPAKKFYSLSENRALPPIKPGKTSKYLDYFHRWKLWADAFGVENVRVKIFDRNQLVGGDVVTDFCSLIDLDWAPKDVASENISLGLSATKFGHLMTEVTGRIDSELELALRKAVSSSGKPARPSRQQAQRFFSQFSESNRKLAQALQLDGELFDSSFENYAEGPQDKWTEDTANDTVRKILQVLAQRYPS
ncbi:hypothetical protein [uncultured Umboniibacter sp.]|uniref:hypothetical protein n=1 Tax=uncultured Umboniibacter sp. TaxID=1798917 RepID=UPI002636CFF8|nr:hypothetical protein [uncultured Umboniibacter sp.]